MDDVIATKQLTVDIQENGIIRAPNGRLIARLVNDIEFDSEHLEQRQEDRPHETIVNGMERKLKAIKWVVEEEAPAINLVNYNHQEVVNLDAAMTHIYELVNDEVEPEEV